MQPESPPSARYGSAILPRHPSGRRSRLPFDRFMVAIALVVICALGGGASRTDTLSLLYVRPFAALALFATLMHPTPVTLQRVRVPLILLSAFAGWIVFQLIPLPPPLWSSLPLRGAIMQGLQSIGENVGWRPISLTPDLTLNSLIALVVPTALLVTAADLTARQQGWLAVVVVGVAASSIVVEVAQVAGGPHSPFYLYAVSNVGTPSGLFANRNHQAVFLACILPLLTVISHPRFSGRHVLPITWSSLAFALITFTAVISTGSRTGMLIAIPLMLYTVSTGINYVFSDRKMRRTIKLATAIAPIVLGLTMLMLGRALSLDRLTGFDAASEQRFKALPTLLQMSKDLIVTGSGFGSFDQVFRMVEPDALLHATFFNHAHNDWLELVKFLHSLC